MSIDISTADGKYKILHTPGCKWWVVAVMNGWLPYKTAPRRVRSISFKSAREGKPPRGIARNLLTIRKYRMCPMINNPGEPGMKLKKLLGAFEPLNDDEIKVLSLLVDEFDCLPDTEKMVVLADAGTTMEAWREVGTEIERESLRRITPDGDVEQGCSPA
tara:strand:+ start:855 stop:1334 length:480 start_codon:yes stop_codon:yes gene_type:complete